MKNQWDVFNFQNKNPWSFLSKLNVEKNNPVDLGRIFSRLSNYNGTSFSPSSVWQKMEWDYSICKWKVLSLISIQVFWASNFCGISITLVWSSEYTLDYSLPHDYRFGLFFEHVKDLFFQHILKYFESKHDWVVFIIRLIRAKTI